MSERKLGILISYINILLHTLIGFLYVPILLHYIGKNEYGLYQLIGSLIAYFGIMDFGLSTAVIRYYSQYKAKNDLIGMENILAVSVRCYAVVTIIALAAGCICYAFLNDIFGRSMTIAELVEAKDIFLLLILNIAVTLLTMVFRSAINANERFLFLKGMETIQLLLQPVLVVLVLQAHPYAFSVALVQTFLNCLLSAVRVFYCFHNLHIKIKYHYWNHELGRGFFKLSLSTFVVTLINQVFWRTNQIILGIVDGTGAVAVYSLASIIYMSYMGLSLAISGVYLPHVSEMVAKRTDIKKLSSLFIQIGRWQYFLLALVGSGFAIFGKQFISIWAGAGFDDAYWITLLIIFPFTIDLIQNIGLTILQAMNQYDFRAKVYFFTGVLNALLAIPLGIKFGGIGCAAATGFSMLIGNGLIMNWFYQTEIHIDIKKFWKSIGGISYIVLLCTIAGFLLNNLWNNYSIVAFGIKLCIYTCFYGLIIYRFAMVPDERKTVSAALSKF